MMAQLKPEKAETEMKRNKEQEQQTEKLQTLVTNTVDINPTTSIMI